MDLTRLQENVLFTVYIHEQWRGYAATLDDIHEKHEDHTENEILEALNELVDEGWLKGWFETKHDCSMFTVSSLSHVHRTLGNIVTSRVKCHDLSLSETLVFLHLYCKGTCRDRELYKVRELADLNLDSTLDRLHRMGLIWQAWYGMGHEYGVRPYVRNLLWPYRREDYET